MFQDLEYVYVTIQCELYSIVRYESEIIREVLTNADANILIWVLVLCVCCLFGWLQYSITANEKFYHH